MSSSIFSIFVQNRQIIKYNVEFKYYRFKIAGIIQYIWVDHRTNTTSYKYNIFFVMRIPIVRVSLHNINYYSLNYKYA